MLGSYGPVAFGGTTHFIACINKQTVDIDLVEGNAGMGWTAVTQRKSATLTR